MSDHIFRVEIDDRGRLSLGGKLVRGGGTYRATVRDDGVIILEPAQVLTEAEIRALAPLPAYIRGLRSQPAYTTVDS